MKQRGVFLIGAILLTIYYFLFPQRSSLEPVLSPLKFESYSEMSPEAGGVLAVGDRMRVTYLDAEYNPVSSFPAASRAFDNGWAALIRPDGVELVETDGRLRVRIPTSGRPMVRRGKLYLYKPESGALAQANPGNGVLMWRRFYTSPVTVLDGSGEKTLVGLLDGRLELIGDNGEVLLEYKPGGSRVEAVYGGALSDDGTRAALISGLEPQRFILLEERKNGFRPSFHHDTGTDFRRAVPVGFIDEGQRILYESAGGVAAVDADTHKTNLLALDGSPTGWRDKPVPGTLLLLGRNGGGDSVQLLTKTDRPLFRTVVDSEISALETDGSNMVLGTRDGLAVVNISAR